MKMKQISDTTLKITMSLEDLMDRGMEIADFLVPQEKTEEFFYAILDELEMPDSFLDTGMLSFRVTPKPDKVDVFAAKGATTVCFPAGTKVHTQWGLADIEKLEVGVPVLTYNEETDEQEYKKVKKVMRRMTRRMCALELSNGTILEVTPEHRFFSNGEWTPIEELNVNDTLQLKDNSIVVIENKIIFFY